MRIGAGDGQAHAADGVVDQPAVATVDAGEGLHFGDRPLPHRRAQLHRRQASGRRRHADGVEVVVLDGEDLRLGDEQAAVVRVLADHHRLAVPTRARHGLAAVEGQVAVLGDADDARRRAVGLAAQVVGA
ncbi:MAG: hypothetical protein ACK55I_18730, partial [bacterium]